MNIRPIRNTTKKQHTKQNAKRKTKSNNENNKNKLQKKNANNEKTKRRQIRLRTVNGINQKKTGTNE